MSWTKVAKPASSITKQGKADQPEHGALRTTVGFLLLHSGGKLLLHRSWDKGDKPTSALTKIAKTTALWIKTIKPATIWTRQEKPI